MLSGGHARNALPQMATVNVNCRMAPGHDPADVRAQIAEGDRRHRRRDLASAGHGTRVSRRRCRPR